MRRLFLLALLALGGCTTANNPTTFLNSLAKDNATVIVKYGGIYGPITVIRLNPSPGSSETVDSQGSITITPAKP